jgi:hypothetical protein
LGRASSGFIFARCAISVGETLEHAQALYEHYAVPTAGFEKRYPSQKPQVLH